MERIKFSMDYKIMITNDNHVVAQYTYTPKLFGNVIGKTTVLELYYYDLKSCNKELLRADCELQLYKKLYNNSNYFNLLKRNIKSEINNINKIRLFFIIENTMSFLKRKIKEQYEYVNILYDKQKRFNQFSEY